MITLSTPKYFLKPHHHHLNGWTLWHLNPITDNKYNISIQLSGLGVSEKLIERRQSEKIQKFIDMSEDGLRFVMGEI